MAKPKKKKTEQQSVRIGSNWTPKEARRITKIAKPDKPATWIRKIVLPHL